MKFSMIQAAREIGVSKSTMHRHIESGRVSAVKLENGGYEIDASELMRAFPPGWKKKGETASEPLLRDDAAPHGTPDETAFETHALKAEIRMLREMLARADLDADRQRREATAAIDDYRSRLDREAEERRALNARLLTYQAGPTAPDGGGHAGQGRRGLFGLFRRAG